MTMKDASIWTWICVLIFAVHISTQNSLRRNGVPKSHRATMDGEITFICPQNGFFPHEEFCEKYYNCSGGNSVPEVWGCRTAADFLFNDIHGECDYAHKVHCGERERPPNVSPTELPPRTTTPAATTTTLAPIYDCKQDGPNGAYPHPLYCEKYFDCWEGVETLLICPNDTLFDVRAEWRGCAPPETVDCGNRTRPPGDFKCPPDAEDGQHYADPWNCAAFFVCTHGLPVHTLCSSGLLYNPLLGVCDYPANVDCSDRHKK